MIKADANDFSFLFFFVVGAGMFVLKIYAKGVQIIIFFNVYKKVFTILHEVTA